MSFSSERQREVSESRDIIENAEDYESDEEAAAIAEQARQDIESLEHVSLQIISTRLRFRVVVKHLAHAGFSTC